MAEESNSNSNYESPFVSWIKLTANYWDNLAKNATANTQINPEKAPETDSFAAKVFQLSSDLWSNWAQSFSIARPKDESPENAKKNRFAEQLRASINLLKSFSQAMAEPESASAAAKSVKTMPEIIMKMVGSSWKAGLQVQQHILEKAGKIGKRTEAYNFENMDQEVFKALSDIYEKEIQQYLHVPQLGLTRFYQERIAELIDKENIFQTQLAEFLSVLYLPMEKSSKVLQEKLENMAGEGNVPKETKEIYGMWVKILEGHYMNLFKSNEYRDSMHNTLSKLEDFVLAKNQTLTDILQFFPIPTNKDMDELYKEFHVLKKRVKDIEKQLKLNTRKI